MSERSGTDEAIAAHLAALLAPQHVLIAAPGAASEAAALAAALEAREIATVVLDESGRAAAAPPGSYDLGILLARPGSAETAEVEAATRTLAAAADALLLIPRDGGDTPAGPAADDLLGWFTLFAEHGFQPVIEADCGFAGRGAFLVDRAAVAGEAELAAFAERLSFRAAIAEREARIAALAHGATGAPGAAPVEGAAPAEAPAPAPDDRDERLAAAVAELAVLRDRLAAAEARAEQLDRQLAASAAEHAARDEARQRELAGWEAIGVWARAAGRELQGAALRVALLRLAPLGLPPEIMAALRPGWRARLRWFGGGAEGFASRAAARRAAALGAAAARVRASPLFDPLWYIACHADVAASGADPALHYVAIGAAAGADPGPWFDTAAYLRAHRGVAAARRNPLLHAIDTGAAARMLAEQEQPISD